LWLSKWKIDCFLGKLDYFLTHQIWHIY
jgi:hypothetical protein